MNYHYLFLTAALLGSVSAAAQTAPTQVPADTAADASRPPQQTAVVQLPWWLPTAAQCADIRALETIEAPDQAARREKRMQHQSKKLSRKYPQATE
ncbi:hypothetical protein [Hymenobacter roseosalivarius]|uniref:hypothetical protein n=1 Tax=Hymenobacter roseosalivarius TaxID=89967 RepID=UPI000A0018DD|nr:hypothetical protein [Hymenobacter roseosalivarius]